MPFDGLDEVPDEATLQARIFPRSEFPLWDRWLKSNRELMGSPRTQLILNIESLPWHFLAVRDTTLTEDESSALCALKSVELSSIPRSQAVAYLRQRIPQTWRSNISEELQKVIQRPLYLQLLLVISTTAWHSTMPSQRSLSNLQRELWIIYLKDRLRVHDRALGGWTAARFERWFSHYAKDSERRHLVALSFQRWPILLDRWSRYTAKLLKSVLSGVILSIWAFRQLSINSPTIIVIGIILAVALFYIIGEGSATQELRLRAFTVSEFFLEMKRQWAFALSFTIGGALVVPLLTLSNGHLGVSKFGGWGAVAIGASFGALLGMTVPTLYEMFYVNESRAGRWARPSEAIRGTFKASLVIGLWCALACFPVIWFVLSPLGALSAVLLFPFLAVGDTLGSPAAAVVVYAARRRGPIRIIKFLELAEKLELVKNVGQYYLLEHAELGRIIADKR